MTRLIKKIIDRINNRRNRSFYRKYEYIDYPDWGEEYNDS